MANAKSPHENLNGKEAIDTLKIICEKARTCMFTTNLTSASPNSTPMTLQEVDEQGNLWFISSSESGRNEDIAVSSKVQLYFMNNDKYEYVYLVGDASIHTDRKTIDKYYSVFANAWFDGKDDPKVTIIKVAPLDSYYYQTKDGKIIAFAKMALVAATGIKLEDGGVEGKLKI